MYEYSSGFEQRDSADHSIFLFVLALESFFSSVSPGFIFSYTQFLQKKCKFLWDFTQFIFLIFHGAVEQGMDLIKGLVESF